MIIFVFGENTFASRRKVRHMREQFSEKFDSAGTNVAEIDGAEEIGRVAQAIQAPPFLSPKRFVLITGLMNTVTRKDQAKPWIEVFKKVSDDTILVFLDSVSVKKGKKHAFVKALSDEDDVHVYAHEELSQGKVEAWAAAYAKERGMRMDNALVRQVVAMVGTDLWQLSGELEKLAARAGKDEITPEMVKEMVRANFEDRMFDLVDALSNGNKSRALELLQEQRRFGSTDFHIFAMLARQLRLLCGAKAVLEENPRAGKRDVAKRLGLHPFVAQKVLRQARGFDSPALRSMHEAAFSFDRRIKTGRMDIDLAVDRLVAHLITTRTRP